MYTTHQEAKYVLSNGIPIPIDRKQARLYIYVYIYIYIDHPAHAHACTSTNMLCKEGVCTYGVPIRIYVCERVHLWAHTRCTRTHTIAHMLACAHPHARTLTDTAHTRCAAPVACVCARARVCERVSARANAQMWSISGS